MLLLSIGALGGDRGWRETLSPHFVLMHEGGFAPSGIVLDLEKLHNNLRLDLSMFSPWMAKERVRVYLYASQERYLRGEFSPPSWSNGIAEVQFKRVVSFDRPSRRDLMAVLGHEMTHLFFETYWAPSADRMPTWLNEGLAMLEEAEDRRQPEKSDWFQTQALLLQSGFTPFERFVKISPARDLGGNKDAVTLWYVQAYSVTHFLYRKQTRLQLFNFCRMLKEGKSLDAALWQAYRYGNLKAFQNAWKNWLSSNEVRDQLHTEYRRVSAGTAAPAPAARGGARSGRKTLAPVGFDSLRREHSR